MVTELVNEISSRGSLTKCVKMRDIFRLSGGENKRFIPCTKIQNLLLGESLTRVFESNYSSIMF